MVGRCEHSLGRSQNIQFCSVVNNDVTGYLFVCTDDATRLNAIQHISRITTMRHLTDLMHVMIRRNQ